MRQVILIGILLFTSLPTIGQQRKATKPRTEPKPTAKWEQYTPCGVYYKDVIDFMEDFGKGWKVIGQTKDEEIWYDSDKGRCMDNGVLKVWIKEVPRNTGLEPELKHTLVLYELKCKTDELRVKSILEYGKDGRVLERKDYPDSSWDDAAPDSMGETIVKVVCRTPS